jgi:hypothetical protein
MLSPLMTRRLFPLLLALSFLTEVRAEVVEFRTVRFDPDDRPSPEYQAVKGSTKFSVPLHSISDSHEMSLRDGKFLDLQPSEGGKPLTLEIPPSMMKDLLLLFIPGPEGYEVLKVHAPAARLGGGDCFMVNACPSDVAIQYGKQKPISVPSAGSAILKSPAGKEYEILPVVIAEKKDKKWEPVRSERWPSDPRFRTILFAYKSPSSGSLEIHAVPERIVGPGSPEE